MLSEERAVGTMQRVRVSLAAAVAADAGVAALQMDRRRRRLGALLEGWAHWCRVFRYQAGFSPQAVGGGSGSKSFDDLVAECDARINGTIDAAVDDLTPAQRAALYRRYELAAVFRFPRDNYADQLDQAHDALMVALPRRGVVLDF